MPHRFLFQYLVVAVSLLVTACGTTPGLHDCDPCIYVASTANGEVTVIDGVTNAVVHTIPAGLRPQFLAVSPDQTRVYVSTHSFLDNDLVTVIDTGTYDIVANIAVGKNPTGLVVSPDGTRLYVVNSADDAMSIIDTGNNAVIDTVPVVPLPFDVVISPDGSRLYVSSESEGTVQTLETATYGQVGETDSVGIRASGLTLNGAGARLYAADHRNGTVAVVNTAAHEPAVFVEAGSGVFALTLHPNGGRLYTVNMSGNDVAVIDTWNNANIGTIEVGDGPRALTIDAAGTTLYTANRDSNDVSAVALSTMSVTTIPVGARPHGIGLVYVNHTDPPDEAIHFVSAVNGAPQFEPGSTTTVAPDDFVSFTVRVPALMAGNHAEVRYYLNPNLDFIGASTGAQKASVCTPVPSTLPLPNGVQSGAQRLDCLLYHPGQPLIVHAKVSGIEAPRDDPYAGVACLSPPLDDCLPVRLAVQPPPGAVPSIGAQRTAIILVSEANASKHPLADKDKAVSLFYSPNNDRSARRFFEEASYGLMTIVGSHPIAAGTADDIYGPYWGTTTFCNFTGVDDPVALSDHHVNFNNYDRLLIVKHGDACTGGGHSDDEPVLIKTDDATSADGMMPMTISSLSSQYFGEMAIDGKIGDTVLHEYGHGLGLGHGGTWDCGTDSLAANGCSAQYDDPINLVSQGLQYAHPHGAHKEKLGWLEGGRILPIWNSGLYTIYPFEDGAENTKVLKIPRKLRAEGAEAGPAYGYYYVSYRQPTPPWDDWAAHAPAFTSGLAIHMDEFSRMYADGALLDMTPGTLDDHLDFRDGALAPGQTFTDALTGVAITLNAVTATEATVAVDIPPRAASFTQVGKELLTIARVDAATVGTVSGGGNALVGQPVTLSATALPGWGFAGWWEHLPDAPAQEASPANPYTFFITNDRVLWARFQPAPPPQRRFCRCRGHCRTAGAVHPVHRRCRHRDGRAPAHSPVRRRLREGLHRLVQLHAGNQPGHQHRHGRQPQRGRHRGLHGKRAERLDPGPRRLRDLDWKQHRPHIPRPGRRDLPLPDGHGRRQQRVQLLGAVTG